MINPYKSTEAKLMKPPKETRNWQTRVSWLLKMVAVTVVGFLMGANRNPALLLLTMAVIGYCAYQMVRPSTRGDK
jgi:hypothetical protein